MFAVILFALLASVQGFGNLACSRNTAYYLNGTPKGGSNLTPANTKIAFIGDNNRYVMELILDEGAELVVHAGDFDYEDDPDLFLEQINDVLGPDFPYIASAGNHDVDAWSGYHADLYSRIVRTGMAAECNGDIGIDFTCSYKGVLLVGTAVGTCSYSQQTHIDYVNEAFSTWGSAWKMCHHHKNQRQYQTGGKSDETGYGILDACRRHGAILDTAHEHSYARTYEMSHFQNFEYDNSKWNPTLRPETASQDGTSFLFVSGLGGESIRGWEAGLEDNEWWAATASDDGCTGYCGTNRATSDGVLFCIFNYNGQADLASCYFKDTNGRLFDEFNITTAVPNTPTVSSAIVDPCVAPFVEVPVASTEDDFSLSAATKVKAVRNAVLESSEENTVVLTFRNVQLKATDKLQGIWLQVYSEEAGQGEAAIAMKALHHDEATSAVVSWKKEDEDWEKHTVWVSPDLTPLIAEIVAKPTWTAGDAITLVLENHGQPRQFRSLDKGLRYAPTLAYELASPCA